MPLLLVGIAIRSVSRSPMKEEYAATIDRENGLVGDFRGKGGRDRKRQVTVLSAKSWSEVQEELGAQLSWTTRRANLLVEGITFSEAHIGKQLHFGDDVVLEITGETSPCNRMDEAYQGLRDALDINYRGGVTCRVVQEGVITIQDEVLLI